MTRQLRTAPDTLRLSQSVLIAARRIEGTVTGITTAEALARAEAAAAQLVRDAKALQFAIRGEIANARAVEREEANRRTA